MNKFITTVRIASQDPQINKTFEVMVFGMYNERDYESSPFWSSY